MVKNNESLSVDTVQRVYVQQRKMVDSDHQRVRNPVTRSRGKVRGQFPSTKMARMIAWESQLERRACYLFEFSLEVNAFREQPKQFHVPFEGNIRKYTPDFELILDSGEIVYVEIKPLGKLRHLLSYFNAIDQELGQLGYQLWVMTEEELIHPIRENNLLFLRSYQTYQLSPNQIQVAFDLFQTINMPTFALLTQRSISIACAYSLIAQHHIAVNLDQEILPESPIYLLKDTHNENNLIAYRIAPDFR